MAVFPQKPNNEEKEDVWGGQYESATFTVVCFGLFWAKMGTDTYNRGRKATSPIKSVADRASLCDLGLRVQLGNQIPQSDASLSWGTSDDSVVGGDVLLLSDCYPVGQEVYEKFTVNGTKYEPR